MSAALTTDVDKRLLRTTKFPPEFNVKVDMKKVNTTVIKKWVSDEIVKILNNDDDVVTDLIFNLIEGPRFPNIKELQISLNGFLDKDAPRFCQELWKLCVSAQENPQGIPKELLEAKKMELIQERQEEDRAREEVRRRQEDEREREREMDRVRDRERGRGRGGRYGGRDSGDRRPPRRDSRSPPPRRRDGDDFHRARTDRYIPAAAGRARHDDRPAPRRRSLSRTHSPSPSPRRRRRASSSPSRSPPPKRKRAASDSRSRSRDYDRKAHWRGDDRRRPRSPAHKRRSPSPRRQRKRSPAGSRSPPPPRRTRRRPSPSRSRSRSRSPPRRHRPSLSRSRSRSPPFHRRMRSSFGANDLMSRTDKPRRDEPRLSRDLSSRSSTPPSRDRQRHGSLSRREEAKSKRRRNTSSVESESRISTHGGAQEHGFSFHHAALSVDGQVAPGAAVSGTSSASAKVKERQASPIGLQFELRMKLLKNKIIREREAGKYAAVTRKDSVVSGCVEEA